MMQFVLTRDSVGAADDADAPHEFRFSTPDEWTWEHLVNQVSYQEYLPTIAGGCATWVLCSNLPLAVAAQQWDHPEKLWRQDSDRELLAYRSSELHLHWSYIAQADPYVVLEIVRRLRLIPP